MARGHTSGTTLTAADISQVAVRICEMWDRYNVQRRQALLLGDEARNYIFAVDVDSTSAAILPHKNRTHQPKLTEISDNLQSQYWDATLSTPDFFIFDGRMDEDKRKSKIIEDWIRSKLEAIRFRDTTGRTLISDFTNYGNVFSSVDYIRDLDDFGEIIYQGPCVTRHSALDTVMNPQATSFRSSPKIIRFLIHAAEVANWPEKYTTFDWDVEIMNKAIEVRKGDTLNDWVQVLKEHGLLMDGFSTFDEYFKQDLVEVLVYRGDMYNPETEELQRNRLIYVIDRAHTILNISNPAPIGYDGLHHAGWRQRNDNLWAQGPLDNLVSMQYRIDHLENLKADVFDIIATPVTLIQGEGVVTPDEGYSPGAEYYMGVDESVSILAPDTTALNADTQIQLYHNLMETFAGAPSESRGIRTPGEKTAFEIDRLDANASRLFVDKARAFERMLEDMLQEIFQLMLANFDGVDFIETFNDVTGQSEIDEIVLEDVQARGRFIAMGSKHWSKRNKQAVEMRDFMLGPMQDPKVRAHVDGQALSRFWERIMSLEDDKIIEPFAGVKEDIHIEMMAREEAAKMEVGAQPNEQREQFASRQGEAQDLASSPIPQGPSRTGQGPGIR